MISKSFSFQPSDTTAWQLTPSFKYDVLCFVNILTADEFYLKYYQKEYDNFKDKLTPEVSEALRSLKKKIRDDGGTIISAWLCLYFSVTGDETIDDMLVTLQNTDKQMEAFKTTPYYSEKGTAMYNSVRKELAIILTFL